MRLFLLIAFTSILLASGSYADVGPTLKIRFNVSDNAIFLESARIVETEQSTIYDLNESNPDIYTAILSDSTGGKINSVKFIWIPDDLIGDFDQEHQNYSIQDIYIPYNSNAVNLGIHQKGMRVLNLDLSFFCNKNSRCDVNESYLSCPEDCLPYEKDGYCNYKPGKKKCDPDCKQNVDYDCKDMKVIISKFYNLSKDNGPLDFEGKGRSENIPIYFFIIGTIIILVLAYLAFKILKH